MSATRALFERRDVIVVASVSCIYGLGDPDAYYGMLLFLEPGARMSRDVLLQTSGRVAIRTFRHQLPARHVSRARRRGRDFPELSGPGVIASSCGATRVDSISTIDPLLGEVIEKHTSRVPIYPKTHYVMSRPTIKRAIKIDQGRARVVGAEADLRKAKLVEAQRLHQRTMFDLEMIKEMGFCRGIENYSRHLTGKNPGEPPPTLLDYLPRDTLIVIDESHQVSSAGARHV